MFVCLCVCHIFCHILWHPPSHSYLGAGRGNWPKDFKIKFFFFKLKFSNLLFNFLFQLRDISVMGDVTKRDKNMTYAQTDKQSLAKFNTDMLFPNNNIFSTLKLFISCHPLWLPLVIYEISYLINQIRTFYLIIDFNSKFFRFFDFFTFFDFSLFSTF